MKGQLKMAQAFEDAIGVVPGQGDLLMIAGKEKYIPVVVCLQEL